MKKPIQTLRRFLASAATALGLAAILIPALASAQSDPNMFDANRMSCRAPKGGDSRIQIAGGEDAKVRDYPFIVQVRVGGSVCGGSLFARGFVLTAAHCVMPFPGARGCVPSGTGQCELVPAAKVSVVRPDASGEPRGESRTVSALAAFPGFRYPTIADPRGALDGDVAILKLSEPFNLPPQDYVQIAAPSFDSSFAKGGECARIAGWGLTDVLDNNLRVVTSGRVTAKLQSLNLALVSAERCADRYPDQITGNMLCAGDGREGYNTCKGDSGGPLVVDVGETVQVGIVSWAYGCAQSEHYTVFTRVGSPAIRGWINKTMGVK